MSRTLRHALRKYCNLNADLDALTETSKEARADDKAFLEDLKRRVHEYMQKHKIECFFEENSKKFIYRSSRATTKPLTEALRALIIQEVEKAEKDGKLTYTDTESLVLTVIELVQQARRGKSESLKISDTKPASIKKVVTPTVVEVQKMLRQYVEHFEKEAKLDESINLVKKDLKNQIQEILPTVEGYCKEKNVIKKPMNYPRQWSTSFTKCITTLKPDYFKKTKQHVARRFLQYKQSKARNRKVTTLRPSKTHMVDLLHQFVEHKKSGWTFSNIIKRLFEKLHDEAEEAVAKKLEANETSPVFKVSMGKTIDEEDP